MVLVTVVEVDVVVVDYSDSDSNSNSNSSLFSQEEKNIFLISDEKLLTIEVLGRDKKTQNCFSEPIRLNAIGITSTIECRKGKELLYEFINDKNFKHITNALA